MYSLAIVIELFLKENNTVRVQGGLVTLFI